MSQSRSSLGLTFDQSRSSLGLTFDQSRSSLGLTFDQSRSSLGLTFDQSRSSLWLTFDQSRSSLLGLLLTNRRRPLLLSSLKKVSLLYRLLSSLLIITHNLFIHSAYVLENETCQLSYLMYCTRFLPYQ